MLPPGSHCIAGARETVRFLPPLNVSESEMEEGLGLFEQSLEDVFGGGGDVRSA
jgi:acetylornithine/succinyldiaminopimelate/putrescine aminotransferase